MENRKIVSPGPDSDVEINPSGEKRLKVSHLGGLILGNDSEDKNNVKLHRGPGGSLQIVSGDDITEEGLDSPNKKVISVSSISVSGTLAESSIIGNSGNTSENIKLRRSGPAKFEIAKGDATAPDGTTKPEDRVQAAMKSVIVGNNSTESDNAMIMVAPSKEINFQEGDSTDLNKSKRVGVGFKSSIIGTKSEELNSKIYQNGENSIEVVSGNADVTHGEATELGRASRNSIQVKDTTVGNSSDASNNVKMRKGFSGEVEFVKENDNSLDNSRSPNKVQVNAKSLEVGSDEINTNNVKIHRGFVGELDIVSGGDNTLDGERSPNKVQINAREVSIGSLVDPSGNVKLHRGAIEVIEIVSGNDNTQDGHLSPNKVSFNAKEVSIGLSTTTSENIKIHKGSSNELEFVSGDDNTLDSVRSPNKAQINAKKVSIGSSSTQSENVKLHRGLEGHAEVVAGDDNTEDGSTSNNKRQINVEKVCIGNSTLDKNVKIIHSADGEMDLVLGNDDTSDGNRSPNKASVNVRSISVGSSQTTSENIKLHKGGTGVLQAVIGSDVTADGTKSTNLSQFSYLLETYSGVSASGQEGRPAWDPSKKDFVVSDGLTWKYIGENKSVATRENLGFKLEQNSPITGNLKISLRQADCLTQPTVAKPVKVSFKNSSSDALWNTLSITSGVDLVLTSDAKFGVTSNLPFRIYIYLINYNGSPEFAVSQKYYCDEDFVTTEGITTTSDYAGKIYSLSSRANVPLACLGYFEATLTGPGYWGTGTINSVYNGDPGKKDDKLAIFNSGRHYGPGDIALSGSKSLTSESSSSTGYVSGNTTFHLTTTGRPVQVMLQPADPQSSSYIKLEQGTNPGTSEIKGKVAIFRKTLNDGVTTYGDDTLLKSNEVIAQFELKLKAAVSLSEYREIEFPTSMISFLDVVGAGIQTYTVCIAVSNSESKITLNNVRLIGYEI